MKRKFCSFDMLEKLVAKKKITFYKISKETGLSSSLFSEWKKGKSVPKVDKLIILANYFGVAVTYFLDNSNEEKDLNSKEEVDG